MKNGILLILLFLASLSACQERKATKTGIADKVSHVKRTYCNPIDIDYSYMSHYAYRGVSYRSGADPAVVRFKDAYYLFVTRSHGYWYSKDMSDWHFIRPQSWYFNGSNAPAACVRNDELLVLGDPSGRGAVIKTNNPQLGNWNTTFSVIPHVLHDPALFVDDDGRCFVYEGSSNLHPIKGLELDPDNHYVPIGKPVDLILLHADDHGWERFGENHYSDIKPYIEGPWMTKHEGKYYLQYAAPGTQWNVYGDGVYVGDGPLGPFKYAPYNPISYKPGGFLNGAGHGSTVQDHHGNYWHYGTMPISVNYKFERRIGMYPAGFEHDGQMYVNTAYGDYPHYLPDTKVDDHKHRFTGWMLLSHNKRVSTNSAIVKMDKNIVDESDDGYMLEQEAPEYDISKINDENIRTYWVAEANHDSIYVLLDLNEKMNIHALQINFQDFNSEIFGRPDTLKHQFVIRTSLDGDHWKTVADYSKNKKDLPHAYIELSDVIEARYIRYDHVYCSNKYLSIAELRVFGKGQGVTPSQPQNFIVERLKDRRDAMLSWDKVTKATGYVIYWGIHPDRLNNSALIYEKNNYDLRALNTDQRYYFQVEAFNEHGISKKSDISEKK